jgi:hypothetical protein
MDVMSELREMGASIQANEFRAVLRKIRDVWMRIPEPKTETSNAYMVLEYGVACSLKLGDLDEAQKWALLAPAFAEKRQDRGEVEFLVGKVAFERGEFAIAKENFIVADSKSEGRIFEGQDKKYRLLIHTRKS